MKTLVMLAASALLLGVATTSAFAAPCGEYQFEGPGGKCYDSLGAIPGRTRGEQPSLNFPKWWDNPLFTTDARMTERDRVVARECWKQAGFYVGESEEEFHRKTGQGILCMYQGASPGFAVYLRGVAPWLVTYSR